VPAETTAPKRTRLWEFNTNLHCSIVGTCLSTGELRQIVTKLGLATPSSTDHELHGTAVLLASRHDAAAKRLHKALDQRHRLAINRFAKAATETEVRALWRESVRQGDIPGAYWATLTHSATTAALVREAFGEVHMLSHLVGAANRADIRRLSQLEREQAELRERLARQQSQLRDVVVTRDAQIRDLRDALASAIAAEGTVRTAAAAEGDPANAPFDVIVLNGATEIVPERLYAQLRDGGRLVGVFAMSHPQRATIVTRSHGDFGNRALFDAAAPVLPGMERLAAFVF